MGKQEKSNFQNYKCKHLLYSVYTFIAIQMSLLFVPIYISFTYQLTTDTYIPGIPLSITHNCCFCFLITYITYHVFGLFY